MSATRSGPSPLQPAEDTVPTKTPWRDYVATVRRYPPSAWKAAAACTLAMALSPAALVTTTTFLVEPIAQDFGWSQSQTLTIFNVPTMLAPLVLPLAGRWVDRWGARTIAVPGTALYALATAVVAVVGASATQLLLALLAFTLLGYVAILGVVYKVVSEWFPAHRASGYSLFIGAASSLGGAVLAPLCQLSVDGLGWRTTYLLLAASILLIVFPAQLFLLSEPAPAPRSANDGGGTDRSPVREELPGVSFGAALRTRAWLVLAAVLVLAAGVAMSVRLNAVSLFDDRGYSATDVSLSVSVLLVASIVGQILAGVVLDRSRSARAFVPFMLCLVAGITVVFAAQGGQWALFLAMALLGAVIGAESSVGPYLVGRYFGLRDFGQIQGMTLGLVTLVGVGLFPVLAQRTAEQTGGYDVTLFALLGVSLLALVLTLVLPRYPHDDRTATATEDGSHAAAPTAGKAEQPVADA
ncbi:MFS transporter [Streptomyces maremycinicus]|uniref:MFS transporter n=1 Tax=Streptomyces maremycinicus TaxID=1679753 RepID=UPI00078809D2|nr:MFS transporter [Streptomyces sp. NBRC 110468]